MGSLFAVRQASNVGHLRQISHIAVYLNTETKLTLSGILLKEMEIWRPVLPLLAQGSPHPVGTERLVVQFHAVTGMHGNISGNLTVFSLFSWCRFPLRA